jgi:phenylalanyl-tRNA synthetase beta chain
VTGKILEIQKHPNADRLQITRVDIGPSLLTSLPEGERESMKGLQIVCGAQNIKMNDIVPVATVGTKLPSGMEIKEAEIRGIKSFGMLCAEDELGLGKDHSGVLILDSKTGIGLPIAEAFDSRDSILDIKVLPDRGHDAVSHIGMAREICALDGKRLDYKLPKLKAKKAIGLNVVIENKELCQRYIGAIMNNIKVQESQQWIKTKLIACGLKPINNIVDATNLVMLETGQPMHAFDFDEIANGNKKEIIIRSAKEGEKIVLLDESEKVLTDEDLVITDKEKVLAIAGIMGGKFSGIKTETKKIILESANFNRTSIRRTKTRHNMKTDASDRYEKGLDPNLTESAMSRLIEIVESFGGKLVGITDNYPTKVKPWNIKLNLEYANKLLGENVPEKSAIKILNNLEIKAVKKGKTITATVPTFRIDLKTQEDLIEEIGRIYGYEKISSQAPIVPVQPAIIGENRILERKIRNILVSSGFSEVHNYSFYGIRDAGLAGLGSIKHLELENPMNPDQALVRASLIPNVLKNIRENIKNYSKFQIFEIGKVFFPNSELLPKEKKLVFGALVTDFSKKAEGFYEMKGYSDSILEQFGVHDYFYDDFEFAPSDTLVSMWHQGRSAEIKIEGREKSIGYIGEINPFILANYGIRKRVTAIEIDLEELQRVSNDLREFKPLRKFPTSVRDISMVAGPRVRVDDVLKSIQQSGGNLVLDVDLFDIFDMEATEEASYAFHITFGADERTLKTEEVDEAMKKITENLENDLGVKVRK